MLDDQFEDLGTLETPEPTPAAPAIVPNAGQAKAMTEIMETMGKVNISGAEHVLMGYAGTGKTTLMRLVVREMLDQKKRVVVCAPTNKAVSVLERNMREAGIEVPCWTIYSLLGLTPGSDDEKRKPKRVGKNSAPRYDVVIIDECSMVGLDLMDWIKRDLRNHFVLYIGDPAQLPPVNETMSQTFMVERKSMLDEIMRQAADNPIIKLATDIRSMIQSGIPDWNRFDDDNLNGPSGVFSPGSLSMEWIEDAFTSTEFAEDNDLYRYLCWTNARVEYVNRHIRKLIYGETETPFIAGERVLVRSPIKSISGDVVIHTNDEATVDHIEAGIFTKAFDAHSATTLQNGRLTDELQARKEDIDVWKVTLRNRAGSVVETQIARDPAAFKALTDSLVVEARKNHRRWHEYFDLRSDVATLQSVYAMTVHCSQGSTFQNVFVDINDCARNSRTVEMLQLLYVGCTRPQFALVLV